MALVGNLLTLNNSGTAAEVYLPETDGITIVGTGEAGDEYMVPTGGIGATQLAANAVITTKIADDAVTLGKQASGTANRLQGFDASGNPSEITVSGATLSAGTLTVTDGTDAKFRGTVANNAALVALSTPLNGDTAYVTDTNGVSGGVNGFPGIASYNGTIWAVYKVFNIMGAATTLAGGAQGEVPSTSANHQNRLLRGDASWGFAIPSWFTAIDYEIGDVIYDPATNLVYRCITAHTSGGSITLGNFTELSPSIGASKSYDAPTAIDGVVCNLTRVGGSAITLSKPSTGHYRLTIPSGADLERGVVFFNNANVDGTTFYLEIDNSANSMDRFIVPYLQYGNTGAWADIVTLGLAPTQNASLNVVTYQVNNASGNGANGFRLIFS
jgi:hypothetical protein